MHYERKPFFDAVRRAPFGGSLSAGQVEGMEAILAEGERRGTDARWLAYMLATAYHETARTMLPINEYGGKSYFDRRYGPGTRVGRDLGNVFAGDGSRFHGRGLVQLTGRANYARAGAKIGVDLVGDPDRALEIGTAVRIMFDGMEAGWFTARKLGDYLNARETDWINARRIINGTDQAKAIGDYARTFYAALVAARRADLAMPDHDQPVIVPAEPAPAPPRAQPDDPGVPVPPEPLPAPTGFWARLVWALRALFG